MGQSMATQQAFGRRAVPRPQPPQVKPRPSVKPPDPEPADATPSAASDGSWASDSPDIDAEIREWKQARKGTFKIPWRQIYVMGGLCFGLASFVVPDSVGNIFQWVLYALAAASFYAGWRKKKDA